MQNHLEIERKYLWTFPLPNRMPNRKVTRYLFPVVDGMERRVQKTVFDSGVIEYRDQIKQELKDGERNELKKEIISEKQFQKIILNNNQISAIERHEYDMEHNTHGVSRITLNHYPALNLSRLEIEFVDSQSAAKYKPEHDLVEIKGPLLRDATLSRLTKEEVTVVIDTLLTYIQ